jgi:hypothetical protein
MIFAEVNRRLKAMSREITIVGVDGTSNSGRMACTESKLVVLEFATNL